jgi:ETC complex I subunit conserved region
MNARIYKPSKNTMQSGLGKTKGWVLELENETKRSPEYLMGWTSSDDTNNQIKLRFDSQEKAVSYALAQGWTFTLDIPHERIIRPRNYADNFRYAPPKDNATK